MLLLYRLLRRKRYRSNRAVRFDAANPPKKMRWRPKLSIFGFLSGLIGGLGAVVLIAQYGIEPVTTRALSMRGAIGAAVAGIGVPSTVFGLVVWRFNKKLAAFTGVGGGAARAGAAIAIFAPALGVLALILAPTQPMAVEGPCTAQLAGVDAAGLNASTGDAIEVPEDGRVDYLMSAPEDLSTWRFWLQYGPYEQLIASGTEQPDDPNDLGLGLDRDSDGNFLIDFQSILGAPRVDGNTVAGSVLTEEWAWMGVGLYEVHGAVTTVSGTQCSGVVMINVEGNPLETVAGAVAAGAAAVGAAGATAVAIGGLRDGGELLDALNGWAGGSGGGPDGGGTPRPPVPPGPGATVPSATTTVVLTGDAARDVLAGGVGSNIPLATPDQYDTYAESDGQVLTGTHLGTHGTVTNISGVVESDDGEIAVSVDVTPNTPGQVPPTPPSPPSAPIDDPSQLGTDVADQPAAGTDPSAGDVDTSGPDGGVDEPVPDPPPDVPPQPPQPGDTQPGDAPVTDPAVDVQPGESPAEPVAAAVPVVAATGPGDVGQLGDEPEDPSQLDPGVLFDVNERMAEEVRQRLDEGYYVRNPNLIVKLWNNFIRDPIWWNDKTGQCGDFADFGAEWSRPWLTEMLGEGTIVDSVGVVEQSTINPQGLLDHIDGLVPVGHAATRVIAPDGQRYILDYWEYMGRMQGVPPRLVPEGEWLERWLPAAGSEGEYMRTFQELSLKDDIAKFGHDEGVARFLQANPGPSSQTIVNSWNAEPW